VRMCCNHDADIGMPRVPSACTSKHVAHVRFSAGCSTHAAYNAQDLGDRQTDMRHTHVKQHEAYSVVCADDSRRRDEGVVASEGVGHKRVVEVVDLVKSVEGPLCERAL
jgi:hypothetical protein